MRPPVEGKPHVAAFWFAGAETGDSAVLGLPPIDRFVGGLYASDLGPNQRQGSLGIDRSWRAEGVLQLVSRLSE
jgi:hypothetical protein